jgi:CheY-like chemotaxis protein
MACPKMKKTILLIEDNVEILENTAEILALEGFEVVQANCGEEGLRLVAMHLPDLVISDIQMPGLNGYEVLEQIRSNHATGAIPFIFLTASAQKEDIEKGKLSGAHAYLTKPFSTESLLAAIQKVLL